jgi:hypothetical protein
VLRMKSLSQSPAVLIGPLLVDSVNYTNKWLKILSVVGTVRWSEECARLSLLRGSIRASARPCTRVAMGLSLLWCILLLGSCMIMNYTAFGRRRRSLILLWLRFCCTYFTLPSTLFHGLWRLPW